MGPERRRAGWARPPRGCRPRSARLPERTAVCSRRGRSHGGQTSPPGSPATDDASPSASLRHHAAGGHVAAGVPFVNGAPSSAITFLCDANTPVCFAVLLKGSDTAPAAPALAQGSGAPGATQGPGRGQGEGPGEAPQRPTDPGPAVLVGQDTRTRRGLNRRRLASVPHERERPRRPGCPHPSSAHALPGFLGQTGAPDHSGDHIQQQRPEKTSPPPLRLKVAAQGGSWVTLPTAPHSLRVRGASPSPLPPHLRLQVGMQPQAQVWGAFPG